MSGKQDTQQSGEELKEKINLSLRILQYLGDNPIKLSLFLVALAATCFLVSGCVTLGFKDDERLLLYHDNAVEWQDLKNRNGPQNPESNAEVK